MFCRFGRVLISLFTILLAGEVRATWFDAAWKFRRPIEAIWDAEHGTGEQLCFATFYTAGHMKPSGEDIRIATDDGKLVASRVIDITGDHVRVIFATPKLEKKFYVYFGNDNPPPMPASVGELKMMSGLLLESKPFRGGRHDSMDELRTQWEQSSPIIGATRIDKPFLGYNPATENDRTISRISGQLFAPGGRANTSFAGSADDRAAPLYRRKIKPTLLIAGFVGDIRFNTKLDLTRGRHGVHRLSPQHHRSRFSTQHRLAYSRRSRKSMSSRKMSFGRHADRQRWPRWNNSTSR